jgi:formylglycine-generating enzyme required for sulfatase activity
MFRFSGLVLVVVAGLLAARLAHAQVSNVFNMPNGEASLQFVTVGNAGNAADPNTGSLYGAVPYVYQMGKYDVTVGQYCQFLNAVAATDTYGLYNTYMIPGSDYSTIGIIQSGSPGSYTYSVSYNASAWQSYATNFPSLYPSALAAANDCPIFAVAWGDAARFCNWLQDGQPTTLGEVANSTETGAYTLNGAVSNAALMAITHNTGATYVIPSENEWYKAAYYNPRTATYWAYPTQSNTAPSNALSATSTNSANYYNDSYTDPTNALTPVGVFAASPGPYGTYDMGGEVWQWNEAAMSDLWYSYRGLRGGDWYLNSFSLASSDRNYGEPMVDGNWTGFRVASVPEPGSITLLVCGGIVLLVAVHSPKTRALSDLRHRLSES